MIDIATIRTALGNPNVRAFLRLIREGESAQDVSGYYLRYHPRQRVFFDDATDHPRAFEVTPNGKRSSAAGAYQITATTWDGLRRNYPGAFPDFHPETQDLAAVALIAGRGALDELLAGNVAEAIRLCGPEWASLPNSELDDGHDHKLEFEHALKVYDNWGGFRGPAPDVGEVRLEAGDAPIAAMFPDPIPPPKEAAPVDPATASLVGLAVKTFGPPLLDLLPWYAKSDTAKRNVAAAQELGKAAIEVAQQVTGAPTAQEATEKVIADPAKREQFVQQMAVRWSDLEPLLQFEEESRDKAAKRAQTDTYDLLPFLAGKGFQLLCAVVIAQFAALIVGVLAGAPEALLVALGTLLVATSTKLVDRWGQLYDYRVGSSAGSKASGDALREIVSTRGRQ